MPKDKFIYLRYPDGREQRLVAGAAGERRAEQEISDHKAKRFEPAQPYTAEDAAKAARAASRPATRTAAPAEATAPAEKPAEPKT